MRLFLASFAIIESFEEIKSDFSFLQAKWVEPASLHLTFRFLGEIKEPQEVIKKLENFTYEPIEATLYSLGTFGKVPKILYAKARGKHLFKLHTQLSFALGLEPQSNFTPHITLSRIKKCSDPSKLFQTMRNYKDKTLGALLPKIHLVCSDLTQEGAKYSIIYSLNGLV